MYKFVVSSLLFLLPVISLQAGIAGTYEVKGKEANSKHHYTGMVTITKNPNGNQQPTYTALWTFDDGQDIGTGIRDGDEIAFVFKSVLHLFSKA
jgi:hypothetical protein